MSRKLLVIGLDGYEASVGDRMMREGRLPALAELTRRSARFHLDHGSAKRTGLTWEHFSTGLSPEAAERWSAVDFDSYHYRCIQKGTALTPFPGKLGVKTVVFDLPYFDIARTPEVEGIVSWGAHDPGTALQANPSSLLNEIREKFGDYPAKPWIYGFTWPSAARTKEMGKALVEATRLRERISRWLLTERMPDWTLGMVVISELHSVIEALWHGMDENHPLHRHPSAEPARVGVEQVYEAVDELVGSLVQSCPEAQVLAFSMHGMGPNESDVTSMVLLPEFLYRRQFGKSLLQVPSGNPEVLAGVPGIDEQQGWGEYIQGCYTETQHNAGHKPASRRIRRWIPAAVKRLIKRSMPLPKGPITHSISWMPATWYSNYWHDMDAFALPSFYDGQIRVNLAGREARGRVALADYVQICKAIEEDLRACIDPRTGRSVVREVIRTHRKDAREIGPTEGDMTIVWEGSQLAFEHPSYKTIGPLPYRRTGGHTGAYGIAWMAGFDIVPGFYGTRSAFDVAPTIRDYLAGPVNIELSGESFLGMIIRDAAVKATV
jgi:predicted AlkP superfamily phosphohydrolase/phosphomutase